MHIIENYFHFFQIQEISRNDEQEYDYEEDATSLSAYFPSKCSYMSYTMYICNVCITYMHLEK